MINDQLSMKKVKGPRVRVKNNRLKHFTLLKAFSRESRYL